MNNQPTRVLLIEDNPGDADLVRLRLIEGGLPVDVNCVNRLADGLKLLAQKPPSVVLLDLNLPDSHGAETFRKVLENAPDVPVVILSGQEDERLAIKAVHQGVQDYLVKSDITGKHLERAMRYAVERQALLRSLDISRKQQIEFKNRFLSHVSHELRTPLTCIHQYVSLLYDGLAGPVLPEQRDHLQTILKSVNQLHAMIRDLLEATRAETGKMRIERRCLALADLVRQVTAMLQPLAQEKRIALETDLDMRVPFVHADPDRVVEVLINLIDNGIKFTPPEGSVVVKTYQIESEPDYAYVSVTDTGRGIAPEALPLIFERMYQDSDLIDGNRTGLGLGLYIAKELITLHGSRIWASSHAGSGSTFTFTLPLYSLPKLLAPAIVHRDCLREAIVLVRVDLTPKSNSLRGSWKDTCQECLDLLHRCVYVDKDLVLPAMASGSPAETFFVVASTDMARVEIMLTRIREQLGSVPQLKNNGTLRVTARPVSLQGAVEAKTLDLQVQRVADEVTELAMQELGCRYGLKEKESSRYAN